MNVNDTGKRKQGSRAHLTLAVAPEVSAVVTGYDLLHMLGMAERASEQTATAEQTTSTLPRVFTISNAKVTEYEGGVFHVEPHQGSLVDTLFSASFL